MFIKIEHLRFVLMELKIVSQKLDSLYLLTITILTMIEETSKQQDNLQQQALEL